MAHGNLSGLRIVNFICEDIGVIVGNLTISATYRFLDDSTPVEQKEALKLNDFERPRL